MKKVIVTMVGPSGSGKTTLGMHLKGMGIPETVSTTTRKPRVGEVEGVHYYFVDIERFEKIEKLEKTEYPKNSGEFYSLTRGEVINKWGNNDIIFASVDINGARQIKKLFPNVYIIYIKVPESVIESRMRGRGDSETNIKRRLKQAKETNEFQNWKFADFILENNDLETAKKDLEKIIEKIRNKSDD